MIGEDADLLTDKPIDPNKETFQVLAISEILDTGYEWCLQREEDRPTLSCEHLGTS